MLSIYDIKKSTIQSLSCFRNKNSQQKRLNTDHEMVNNTDLVLQFSSHDVGISLKR